MRVATVVVALVGLVCLTHTRRTLSGTFDESNHLAAGLEWWQFGSYSQWTENPPLPRLAIAALPYLHGMRLPAAAEWDPRTHDWDRSWEMGGELLYGGEGFETNLGRARLGTFPFFLIALAAVWGLADGRRRPVAGLIAVALTATLPALIAHGALATTDVAFAGTFLLALLALARWFDQPTRGRAALVGAASALALLTKFSTLVFFPVALIAFVVARRMRLPARPDTAGPLAAVAGRSGRARGAVSRSWSRGPATASPSDGIDELPHEVKGWLKLVPPVAARAASAAGCCTRGCRCPSCGTGSGFSPLTTPAATTPTCSGRNAAHGFVAFYPIALAVKTPLPLLALLLLAPSLAGRCDPGTATSEVPQA